jgi:hypothetical protein
MPKKKDYDYQEESPSEPVAEVEQPKQYYTLAMWSGIVPIYKCVVCKQDSNDEDEMILHVVTHVEYEKRVEVLSKLLKDKEQ